MKRPALRALFDLLLVWALLFQGYAAAAMPGCLSMTASRLGAGMADAPMRAMSLPGHSESPDAGEHCPHASVDQPYDAGVADAPDAAAGSHSCNACAAACIGGALTASAPCLPAEQLHERPMPVSCASAAFITEGPERPPRSFLA